jgi:hypothetical protein
MSATWELFERWKARKGHESNNAAASDLGTARQTVQNWKDGRNGDAHFIERMAKDLGEDPVPVILEAFAEAARDAQAKRTLQRLAKRFRGAALAVALGALPLMAPSAAQARSCGLTSYALCEHRNASRRLQRSTQHGGRFPKRRTPTWKPPHPASRLSA